MLTRVVDVEWSGVEWTKTRLTVRQQLVFLKVVIDHLMHCSFQYFRKYRKNRDRTVVRRVSFRAGFEDGCYNSVFPLSRNRSFRYCSVH